MNLLRRRLSFSSRYRMLMKRGTTGDLEQLTDIVYPFPKLWISAPSERLRADEHRYDLAMPSDRHLFTRGDLIQLSRKRLACNGCADGRHK